MKYSVIVPVYNEEKNVIPLAKEILSVMSFLKSSYEIIFIDDGSTDLTYNNLIQLQKKNPKKISIIQFRINFGKAAAYDVGFKRSIGDIVITLDGDGQDDPKEFPKLIKKLDEGFDMVSGWKITRKDSFIKNISSGLFNFVVNYIFKIKLHDINCGLKVYRKDAVKALDLYGRLHRYIPVLLTSQGYKVSELPINHRKRLSGRSKYGAIRFINGFLDLFTVFSITKFRSRPMHVFGYVGIFFFIFGFIGCLLLTYDRVVLGLKIGDRPLLLLSIMLIIVGIQIGISGLVGEYIIKVSSSNITTYNIKQINDHQ